MNNESKTEACLPSLLCSQEDDFELLIFLPVPPQSWGCRHVFSCWLCYHWTHHYWGLLCTVGCLVVCVATIPIANSNPPEVITKCLQELPDVFWGPESP